MITWREAQQRFDLKRQERFAFCRAALDWIRRHRLTQIREAWMRCEHPAWMLWWLNQYCLVDDSTLSYILNQPIDWTSSRRDVIACDEIRTHFTYYGRSR